MKLAIVVMIVLAALGASPMSSHGESPECTATVTNNCPDAITISVTIPGVSSTWYGLGGGQAVSIALTKSAQLCIWECPCVGCWWSCGYTICPGGAYSMIHNQPCATDVTLIQVHEGVCECSPCGCNVPALAPLPDDPVNNALENGVLNTDDLSQQTRDAYNCFLPAVAAAGGTVTTSSAYRTPAYQSHLAEVYRAWAALRDNTDCECQQRKSEVQQQFAHHGLGAAAIAPAGMNGRHTTGLAVDMTVHGVNPDPIAAGCDLTRRFPLTDPVHFEYHPSPSPFFLAAASLGPDFPAAVRFGDGLSSRPEARRPSEGDPPVSVTACKTDGPAGPTYTYYVTNQSPDSVLSIVIGYDGLAGYGTPDARPKLRQRPRGWTLDDGIPIGSATAPTGWAVSAFGMEECDSLAVQWRVATLGYALPPGGAWSSMSVSVDAADPAYESGRWTAYLSSASSPVITGQLAVCPQPPAEGSCCAPDGSCTVTTQANCTGTWTEAGVCVPSPCVPATGACCFRNAYCRILTPARCVALRGIYVGGVCAASDSPRCSVPAGGKATLEPPDSMIVEPPLGALPLSLEMVPNPGTSQCRAQFSLVSETTATVEVFDLTGARVRVLARGVLSPGKQTVAWDGRGDDGQTVPAGVYFVRVTTGQESASGRVVLTR